LFVLEVVTEMLDEETKKIISTAQRNEITEHFIYERLSRSVKDPQNKRTLERISGDELRHYDFWKRFTNEDVKPDKSKVWWYFVISRIFGLTFGIKLMEKGEERAQVTYQRISESVPEAESIVEDEDRHESELVRLIDEERLRYIGSMILGLNDALVELTGALAGFTFALQDTHLVAVTGFITGIAASLSMAASEYLSTKSEETVKNPVKASVYTGVAYIFTVLFLILPYILFTNLYLCLGAAIFGAISIVFVFTFYISVAKDVPFMKRFIEMTSISLAVAALTFAIGFLVRTFLNIEI